MAKKYNWIIHYVFPGSCREKELVLPKDVCPMVDCHTHGLARYGKELQLILPISKDLAACIINNVGTMMKDGRKLRDGDLVTEVLTGGEPIRIREIGDHFRLIFRDSKGRWPEDAGCDFPFCIQEEPFAF